MTNKRDFYIFDDIDGPVVKVRGTPDLRAEGFKGRTFILDEMDREHHSDVVATNPMEDAREWAARMARHYHCRAGDNASTGWEVDYEEKGGAL